MAVLLLAEVNDGELALDATAKAVTAAKALGDVTVLACRDHRGACGRLRTHRRPSHHRRKKRDAPRGGIAGRDDHL